MEKCSKQYLKERIDHFLSKCVPHRKECIATLTKRKYGQIKLNESANGVKKTYVQAHLLPPDDDVDGRSRRQHKTKHLKRFPSKLILTCLHLVGAKGFPEKLR